MIHFKLFLSQFVIFLLFPYYRCVIFISRSDTK
nr:MAG TPA: hypothetical protein [Caudoviricetes sp.]